MARKRLGEILIDAGVIDEFKLKTALAEQRRWGGQLGKILVEMGIAEETMMRALSAQLNFPLVDLDTMQPEPTVLAHLTADFAEQHAVIPFAVQGKFIDLALSDATNLKVLDEVRIKTQLNVRPHLAGPKMIERALGKFYGRGFEFSMQGDERRTGAAGNLSSRFDGGGGSGASARALRDSQSGPRSVAASRRAPQFDQLGSSVTIDPASEHELAELAARVSKLEALVARDEDVLRKLLAVIVDKGLATREEIMERLAGP